MTSLDIANALSSIKNEDGALDWKESVNSDMTSCEWHKELSDAILQLTYNSNTKESICYKVYPDGRKRREAKGCKVHCNKKEIQSILREL